VIILLGYVGATLWLRRSPRSARLQAPAPLPQPETIEERRPEAPDIGRARLRLGLAAAGILVAGPFVALAGQGIADTAGIGETLVGTVLVALATTLPELIVVLGAMRLGAHDLAVGALFGSCAFNSVLLFVGDLSYTEGPILSGASPAQAVAGASAVGLIAIALAVLIQGEETRIHRLEPDAVFLLAAYVAALVAVGAATA
jgi:cation:H+ antiporter